MEKHPRVVREHKNHLEEVVAPFHGQAKTLAVVDDDEPDRMKMSIDEFVNKGLMNLVEYD